MVASVHVNKHYEDNQVRHLSIYPSINTSISGQYESTNFQTLVDKINALFENGTIYFVDTRQTTHFELNNRAVALKTDNNSKKTSEEIMEREQSLAKELLSKTITFVGNHMDPVEEEVTNSSSVKEFVENYNNPMNNSHVYIRLALDENGPLTDAQVETYLSLLDNLKKEQSWLHANAVFGQRAEMLLALMKDILENAATHSLEELNQRYKSGKLLAEVKDQDEAAPQKRARAEFIRDFYTYAKSLQDNQLSWSEWKNQPK